MNIYSTLQHIKNTLIIRYRWLGLGLILKKTKSTNPNTTGEKVKAEKATVSC